MPARTPCDARSRPAALVALAACTLLGALPMAADAQPNLPPTGFEEGEPFPVLALPSLKDGEPMSVADFRGHKTIVHVFASW